MRKQYDRDRAGVLALVLFGVCAAAYLLLLFAANQRIVTVDVSGCDTSAAEQMEYKIEKVECRYGYVEVRGYAYEPGVSVDTADTQLLAYDPVSGVYYGLPTENVKKEKLTENADDGFNYDYAQFWSAACQSSLPGGCRICIWYRGNGANRLISTEEVLFY